MANQSTRATPAVRNVAAPDARRYYIVETSWDAAGDGYATRAQAEAEVNDLLEEDDEAFTESYRGSYVVIYGEKKSVIARSKATIVD